MRALLDLTRDEAAVQDLSSELQELLLKAGGRLKTLDPKHGEKELIKSVADVLTKLSQPLRKP